ncbi:MAG: hypothetical protein QGH93_13095 [Gammaproteobacteria bacterium]|nr:hypothetical protein [Gammaproteobacteria bacterium]
MNATIQTKFTLPGIAIWYVVALVIIMVTPVSYAGEPFEISTHDVEVYGTYDIVDGEYEKAIDRLQRALKRTGNSSRRRVPYLTNLCVAYTMMRNLEKADKYCNEAIETQQNLGLAYNNRGVFNIASGDYIAACADFESALNQRGGGSAKRKNLSRCVDRLTHKQLHATLATPKQE